MNKIRNRQLIRKYKWLAVEIAHRRTFDFKDAVKYCNRTFESEKFAVGASGTYHTPAHLFLFKDEPDATLFRLRWC